MRLRRLEEGGSPRGPGRESSEWWVTGGSESFEASAGGGLLQLQGASRRRGLGEPGRRLLVWSWKLGGQLQPIHC
jgi:hypothetical protein